MANISSAYGKQSFTHKELLLCKEELKAWIENFKFQHYGICYFGTRPDEVDILCDEGKGIDVIFDGNGRWTFNWFCDYVGGVEDLFFGSDEGEEIPLVSKIKSENITPKRYFIDYEPACDVLYEHNSIIRTNTDEQGNKTLDCDEIAELDHVITVGSLLKFDLYDEYYDLDNEESMSNLISDVVQEITGQANLNGFPFLGLAPNLQKLIIKKVIEKDKYFDVPKVLINDVFKIADAIATT